MKTTERILETYQDKEHQPDFYVSKSYFMVTLHSLNPIEPNMNLIVAPDAQNEVQNDTQKVAIIDLIKTEIRKNPFITREELAEKLSKSKATITSAIKNSSEIKFVCSSKSGHWEIIDKKDD